MDDNVLVHNVKIITQYISTIVHNTPVKLTIGINEKVAMNEATSIPMMYYDKLNVATTHIEHIKTGDVDKCIHPNENKDHELHPVQKAINLMKTTKSNLIAKFTNILPKSKVRGSKLTQRKLKLKRIGINGN